MDESPTIDDGIWERPSQEHVTRRDDAPRRVLRTTCETVADLGISKNIVNLRNKVSCGRFTAPFFAKCMVALVVELLQIPKPDDIEGDATG
jgi:hypothetical protein